MVKRSPHELQRHRRASSCDAAAEGADPFEAVVAEVEGAGVLLLELEELVDD